MSIIPEDLFSKGVSTILYGLKGIQIRVIDEKTREIVDAGEICAIHVEVDGTPKFLFFRSNDSSHNLDGTIEFRRQNGSWEKLVGGIYQSDKHYYFKIWRP